MALPAYQGKLDGLCGFYAIVNALRSCSNLSQDILFQTALKSISKRRWPNVIWEGITFRDLQKSIRYCISNLPSLEKITVSYPFFHQTPLNNKIYWKEFDTYFTDDISCAIIGMTQPSAHWIVVKKEENKIHFTDSNPELPFQVVDRSAIFAGLRNRKNASWVIDRKELILFHA